MSRDDAGPGAGPLAGLSALPAGRGPAPVHLWDPPYCGEMDLEIRADGSWWHEGAPIRRAGMVKLFASILKREGDRFYLVTPVEKVGIRVIDAPFLAVDAKLDAGQATLTTSLGETAAVGPDHPIRVAAGEGGPRPYVMVRSGLEALIDRKTFYRLAEAAVPGPDGRAGLHAGGAFFPLEP